MGAIIKKNFVHAAGGVDAAGAIVAPAAGNAGGFTVAGPAASVFTVTLSDAIDRTERIILVGPRGVLDSLAVAQLVGETDTAFTVSTGVANTGAAGDRAFDMLVARVAF
ncbi:MAG: hypothetical protein EHM88_06540 [Candidatus Rokuibacteriota bacterium]|nr:MAG: hypothetical protein EHM88_06540 [Candidatus Rokubacteria bacterium]